MGHNRSFTSDGSQIMQHFENFISINIKISNLRLQNVCGESTAVWGAKRHHLTTSPTRKKQIDRVGMPWYSTKPWFTHGKLQKNKSSYWRLGGGITASRFGRSVFFVSEKSLGGVFSLPKPAYSHRKRSVVSNLEFWYLWIWNFQNVAYYEKCRR